MIRPHQLQDVSCILKAFKILIFGHPQWTIVDKTVSLFQCDLLSGVHIEVFQHIVYGGHVL